MTYGGLASTGRFAAGDCVELFYGSERVGHTYVTGAGTFAFQFVVGGDGNGGFTLRVSNDEEGTSESLPVSFEHVTQAEITYPANTTPLLARADGLLEFNGSLEPESPPGSRLSGAWMVNWNTGAVARVSPTPFLSTPFTATVAGGRGSCAAIVSEHADGVGGCWWPRGGGGCAPICTEEEFRAGTCGGPLPPCEGRRGCELLDVLERVSDTPPPETDRSIPVLPPPPDPIDAGRPDAPRPDASEPDAGLE